MNIREIIESKQKVLTVPPDQLLDTLASLKREHQFQILLDIVAIDRGGNRFELIYLLLSMEYHWRLQVRTLFNRDEVISSVQKIWSNAYRLEHEVWDMMGVKFDFQQEEGYRFLTMPGFVGHPLRKDFGRVKKQKAEISKDIALDNWLTVHPHHPAMDGSLQLQVHLDGEIIRSSVLETGFLHRGIEKISETRNFNQILPLIERLNHHSAAMNGIAWAKAVEEHLKIDISERSKVLRMIFCELSRIYDHISLIIRIAHIVESHSIEKLAHGQRSVVASLFRSYCNEGLLSNVARVGGLCADIPLGWVSECYQKSKIIHKELLKLYRKIVSSRIWIERTRICSITSKEAIDCGCTGPCLRACGVNYDIRKVSPYYFYDDLDFEIPLGLNGDAYDRVLVRIEECLQSISIIGQLLDNVPNGETRGIFVQNLDDLEDIAKMEAGESYSFIEAANGELGFYIQSDGSSFPSRLKIRTPSLPLAQVFPNLIKGATLSDALLGLKSLNIVAGELDR